MSRILLSTFCASFICFVLSHAAIIDIRPAKGEEKSWTWALSEIAPVRIKATCCALNEIGIPPITEAWVHNIVELGFRRNGVPVSESTFYLSIFKPDIIVRKLNGLEGYYFVVFGYLETAVTIPSINSLAEDKSGGASVWSRLYVGHSGRNNLSDTLRRALNALTEDFSLDYLRENPR